MSMLQDPDMKEIVDDFCDESAAIYDQLTKIIHAYLEAPSNDKLEQFGQAIDRVMGAAKSVGANVTGEFTEFGKVISYKASQIEGNAEFLMITVRVLHELNESLKIILQNIRTNQSEQTQAINIPELRQKLTVLSEKLQHIARASVAH